MPDSSKDEKVADNLPDAECRFGYPVAQLTKLFSNQKMDHLHYWMRGQTMTLCEGRRYNHNTGEYEVSCEGVSHGVVIYRHDLIRFLEGGPILD
jgi:hypothetical protein